MAQGRFAMPNIQHWIMFDGIKISYSLRDFPKWRQIIEGKGISLLTRIDTTTGEFKENSTCGENGTFLHKTITHTGQWREYKLTVKEIDRANNTTACYLSIEGSLHKSYFGGSNFAPFKFKDSCTEIDRICSTLHIDERQAKIKSLEFGVNIRVSFPPYSFLRSNLISYKGDTFSNYNKDARGICLGYHCQQTEYEIKIYDKGLQYDLSYHLLRFEQRCTKLRPLSKIGICTLHDLKRPEILPEVGKILFAAWHNVLLFDDGIRDATGLTGIQGAIISNANNPKYWEALKIDNIAKFNRYRRVYRAIVARYGNGYHTDIYSLICHQWQELTATETQQQNNTECTIFPIKIKGEIGTLPVNPPRSWKQTNGKEFPVVWNSYGSRLNNCIHDIP